MSIKHKRKSKPNLTAPRTFGKTRQRVVSNWDCLGTRVDQRGDTECSGFVLTPYGYVFAYSAKTFAGKEGYTNLEIVQGGRVKEWADDAYRCGRTLASVARKWAAWLHERDSEVSEQTSINPERGTP